MATQTTITPELASKLVAVSAEHTAQGDGRLGSPHHRDGVLGSVLLRRIASAADITLVVNGTASELWVRSAEHGTLAVYLHPEAEKIAHTRHP